MGGQFPAIRAARDAARHLCRLMPDSTQSQVLDTLLFALEPVVRALLRAGVAFREFEEIAKTAFVNVATNDYGIRGRPTNISRVAAMTGITRKEVRRLRDKAEAGYASSVSRPPPLAAVLERWATDRRYADRSGKPADLPFDGTGATFTTLVRSSAGDVPPGALRTELKRVGAVEETKDGVLRLVKATVVAEDVSQRLMAGLRDILHPAGLAVAHNIGTANDRWAYRTVFAERVREEDLPRIRRTCSDRIREAAETVNNLFEAYSMLYADSEVCTADGHVAGVGVFYFEDEHPSSSEEATTKAGLKGAGSRRRKRISRQQPRAVTRQSSRCATR